jgi:hypothetical protein
LANCPYAPFFDTATLCNPENEETIRQLSQKRGKETINFFNTTFRSAKSVLETNVQKLFVVNGCCGVASDRKIQSAE